MQAYKLNDLHHHNGYTTENWKFVMMKFLRIRASLSFVSVIHIRIIAVQIKKYSNFSIKFLLTLSRLLWL